MATLQEVESAFLAADRAGDAESARVLAQEVVRLRSLEQSNTPSGAVRMGAGVLRGARDVIDAGAQMLPRAMERVTSLGGLAPNPASRFFASETENVDAINRNAEAQYQANFRQGQTGTDWPRLGGNLALNALATRRLAPAGTLIDRMKQGAAVGGAAAAAQPVQDTENFWTQKAAQTAFGAATGFAATPLMEGITRGGAQAVNAAASWVRGLGNRLTGATSESAVQARLAEALKAEGVNWGDLAAQTQATLMREAQKALRSGADLPGKAAARTAEAKGLGVDLMLGQATRDPVQFSRELNLRGVRGVGDPIQQRLNQQTTTLFDRLEALQPVSMTPVEAGRSVMNALSARDASMKGAVDRAYEAARGAAGLQTPLDPSRFSNGVISALDDRMVGDALPAGIRDAVNRIAKGELPFTVQKAQQIIQNINGQNLRGRELLAANIVKEGLDAEIQAASTAAGSQFRVARDLASQRFKWQDSVPAAKATIDGTIAPDDFVRRYVVGGKVDEIKALMQSLSEPERQILRGQVVDVLRRSAGKDATGEFSAFSERRFNDEIARLGKEKLEAILGKSSADALRSIGRVATYIGRFPAGDSVNSSKTAAAQTSSLLTLLNMPALRPVVGEPVERMLGRAMAERATAGGLFAPAQVPGLLSDQAINRAAMRAGLLGSPLAIGGASALAQ